MIITALTKFTTIDYPGKLACIIFTGGCNLRCGFCHNAEFVLPEALEKLKDSFLDFHTIKNFLRSRKDLLEGVVICGGEPTVHPDLLDKMKEIKKMGFAVKLDTNGTNPAILKKAIKEGLVDYIAMDIKDIPASYRRELVGVTFTESPFQESIKLIKNSGVNYEFRTTVIPAFHNLDKLKVMGEAIKGAKLWALQVYRNQKTLKPEFSKLPEYSVTQLQNLAEELRDFADKIIVRN